MKEKTYTDHMMITIILTKKDLVIQELRRKVKFRVTFIGPTFLFGARL